MNQLLTDQRAVLLRRGGAARDLGILCGLDEGPLVIRALAAVVAAGG